MGKDWCCLDLGERWLCLSASGVRQCDAVGTAPTESVTMLVGEGGAKIEMAGKKEKKRNAVGWVMCIQSEEED